ncbi:MAG: tetratricopeptide repeat protein [Acidobacteriota bacterium]
MIEAPCAACGTLNRIAEADLPAGAKFVTCSTCKSRVALPIAKTVAGATPTPKAPAIPAIPPKAPPDRKTPPPIPAAPKPGAFELADLPAPKRQSALAGVGDAKPAQKSPLASFEAELPAPKPSRGGASFDDALPAPKPSRGGARLDDALPAPKPSRGGARLDDALPAPKPSRGGASVDDALPAPSPSAARTALGLAALPAPKPKATAAAPKPPPPDTKLGLADLPARKPRAATDLPAPKPPSPGIVDLPAPKQGLADLPAPKAPAAQVADVIPDLLDLPMPRPAGIVDLPTPKQGIVDLPAPKQGGVDLPAPKGFFDDLPQPARSAPTTDVAPKGFFDDLPQPARSAPTTDVAPKGFFDDLPQPVKPIAPPKPPPATQQGVAPAPAPRAGGGGFFDDLPPPVPEPAPAANSAGSLFDDLAPAGGGAPAPAPPAAGNDAMDIGGAFELDLGGSSQALELDHGPADMKSAGDIDLPEPGDSSGFGDLDLSEPSAKPGVRISTPEKPAKPPPRPEPAPKSFGLDKAPPAAKGALELELEGAAGAPAAVAKQRQAQKKQQQQVSAEDKAAKQKRTRVVLASVLGVALLGGGGFYMYQRHAKAEERAEQIDSGIKTARAALVATDAKHWMRAASAAQKVIELDGDNGPALGIAAEAMLGGALDTGVNGPARIAGGRKRIADAIATGHAGPELARAQALAAIAGNQPDVAITKLQPMLQASPKNAFLNLYLGWALLAKGDAKGATAAFDVAAADPATKLAALYGRARAKLLAADPAGAKADFAAVYDADKTHVGAQVGLAETLPPSQSSEREAELLAILQRKDLDQADPRAVVLAWSLAGDIARTQGRLDVARERYHKALAVSQNDVTALIGLAAVELRDGKAAVAADLIQKALAQSPSESSAKIVLAEIAIKQGKLPDATALIKELANRVPPLPPLLHAQLQIAQGHLDEAQGLDDDAVEAYEAGAKDAGDLDLAPTMAAVEKLGQLAKKADEANNAAKAADYRDHADKLLSGLADRAREDAQLSLMLGVAYLQAGDATKAEGFLRRATEMRANDVEAKLELAKALAKLSRSDDAIEQLKAALAIDASRADIALELARTYEIAGKDDEAKAAYDKLLAAKDVTIAARARAGRFFARKGDVAKAAKQGDAILLVEPDNAAGHYLKGEGLLAQGPAHLDDARKELAVATDSDPDPQYLDAQGRCAEAMAAQGEPKYLDLALRAYGKATDTDPNLFNAWAGQGRVHVARHEWADAVKPLEAANKLDPKDGDVMFNLGVTAEKLGQKPSAIAWFVASTKVAKSNMEAWHHLGQLYVDVNRAQFAVQAYTDATRLAAEHEKQTGKQVEWLTDDYYQLGEWALSLHDSVTARNAWEKYVGRNPPPGARLDEARSHLATDLK